MNSIIINKHFCGPPNSGNGGYVCGRLAHYIPGSAEVTLHLPPPLEKPLEVSAKNNQSWELSDGDKVVASGGRLMLNSRDWKELRSRRLAKQARRHRPSFRNIHCQHASSAAQQESREMVCASLSLHSLSIPTKRRPCWRQHGSRIRR